MDDVCDDLMIGILMQVVKYDRAYGCCSIYCHCIVDVIPTGIDHDHPNCTPFFAVIAQVNKRWRRLIHIIMYKLRSNRLCYEFRFVEQIFLNQLPFYCLEYGYLDLLNWHESRRNKSQKLSSQLMNLMMEKATLNGHLEVMMWIYDELSDGTVSLGSLLFECAIRSRNLRSIEWLASKRCKASSHSLNCVKSLSLDTFEIVKNQLKVVQLDLPRFPNALYQYPLNLRFSCPEEEYFYRIDLAAEMD